jgi:hypothetical protein
VPLGVLEVKLEKYFLQVFPLSLYIFGDLGECSSLSWLNLPKLLLKNIK